MGRDVQGGTGGAGMGFRGDGAELVVNGLVLGEQDTAAVLAHEVPHGRISGAAA